jgi:alpha-L-fucosidase
MKLSKPALLAIALGAAMNMAAENNKEESIPKPSPAQLAWQEAELGVVFHYDLHIFDDKHYRQGDNRRDAVKDVNIFNPTQLDTDQWVKTAKDMGARFAILTASHETGFRLWLSDVNPYCLKAVKWGNGKRDIVREFIDSCRKYGLKPGIYMGTRWNSHLQILDFKVTPRSKITQREYNHMIEAEVAEICRRYGPLFELWFDGGAYGPERGGPDVLSIFEKYQPNCIFYHNHQRADVRWGGSESGTVPYPCWATMPFNGYSGRKESKLNHFYLLKHGDPHGKVWCPAVSDAPLRNHEWFWDKGDDRKVRPLKQLVNIYCNSVGHNSTLIIGLTPDARGLMPEADVKRCKEWGDAIRKMFGKPLARTSGDSSTVELTPPSAFDAIILRENICEGERVREYVVEAYQKGKWSEVARGTCIGNKRIIRLKQPLIADKLRLRILKSIAPPLIRDFSIYNTTN